jgi:3',5'-cyclic AMP phosphodiesterase CpdA
MSKLTRALKVIGVIAIVLIVIYSGIAVWLYSSAGKIRLKPTAYPPAHIKNLIWPTIGYPSLVTPGARLEVEFDLNEVGPAGGDSTETPSGWQAVLKPARAALAGLSYRLLPTRTWRDVSSRWPRGTARGGPYRVWHAQFLLSADAVPELYDLTVEADAGGKHLSDSQPHAVSVSESIGNDFRFVTLADIHVHQRNISGVFQKQTNKGISSEGRPVFFENAIAQVNLIRPDFVVMLGDFVYAQHAAGEYQPESEEFYRALSGFEVPVFAVPGNHDQYVNQVNGARVWEQSMGPLFYSFDVGDCHFTAVNTSEWPESDRQVMSKLGLFVYPRKWQGQVLEATNEKDPGTYRGQLARIRDDLASHQGSKLRVILMHHDPYRPGGTGKLSWNNERFAGLYSLGGGGKGRVAIARLAAKYRVAMVFTGHIHSDYVGSAPWSTAPGRTVYANQTCVYFDEGGVQDKYPGYRLVDVEGGTIKGYTYTNSDSSIPFYDGSVPNGMTDLDHLDRPALAYDSDLGSLRWNVSSYLAVPVELRGISMVVPNLPGGYAASNGEVYRTVTLPGGSQSLVYVRVPVAKGVPGKSATSHGTPSEVGIQLMPRVPAASGAGATGQ